VSESKIIDIDEHECTGIGDTDEDLFRLYYSTRNIIYFQKTMVTNKFLYSVNRLIYWPLFKAKNRLNAIFNKSNRKRINVLLNAISDGFNGRLGKRDDIAEVFVFQNRMDNG
jgi:hypothetical protein